MPPAQITRAWLPWILAAAIAATGWVALHNRPAAPLSTPELGEFALNGPASSRLGQGIAVSPDGRYIASIATSRTGSSLWVRPMRALEWREIPDTRDARNPFWSPDSKTIGYFQGKSLKTAPVDGGSPFTVYLAGPAQTSPSNNGGTWSGDGVIVFGPHEDGALYQISATGGTPTPVTVPNSTARGDRWPWFLDDGQHFLYLAGDTTFELRVGSLRSAAVETIGLVESHASYGAGYLYFVRGGNLMGQRFNPNNRKLLGDPIDLGLRTGIEPHNQLGMFAVSAAGPLVYRAAARTNSQLTWIDRSSGYPRDTVGDVGVYFNLDLSPDEGRLGVSRMTERDARQEFDIWTIELSTGDATRVTDDYPAWQFDPTWSPDGKRLAFNEKPIPTSKGPFGLSVRASSGHGETESLVPSDTSAGGAGGPDWSVNDIIVYHSGGSSADLWTIAMSGDRKPRLFLDTAYLETNGTLSPNSRWIAHQSNASGRSEIVVRPFPNKDSGRTISREAACTLHGGGTARNCSSWRRTAR